MRLQVLDFVPTFKLTFSRLLLLGVLLLEAPGLRAQEVSARTAQIAATAREAYDAGRFAEAADLYLKAWQSAPTQTGLLYNAARASHLASQWREADQRYQQFLNLPEHDRVVDDKVRAYREQLRQQEAQAQAAEASRLLAAGQAAQAAGLYREALQRAPEQLEWLPPLAEAEAQNGQVPQARQDWQRYLQQTAEDAPQRAQVQIRLTETDQTVNKGMGRTPGWIGAGLAVAAGATAIVLAVQAGSTQKTLNAQLADRDAQGHIRGVGWDEAQRTSSSIAQQKTAALIVGVTAIGLAGVSTWWLLRRDTSTVAVSFSPTGILLTGNF